MKNEDNESIAKINKIASQIEELSFEEKCRLYTISFGFGSISSTEMNEKLVVISLIAFTSSKLKEKNPGMTTLDFLVKITGAKKNDRGFYSFIENLSILADDLSYCSTKYDTCGLKTSGEIINKIKEILQTWLPF